MSLKNPVDVVSLRFITSYKTLHVGNFSAYPCPCQPHSGKILSEMDFMDNFLYNNVIQVFVKLARKRSFCGLTIIEKLSCEQSQKESEKVLVKF